MHLAAADRPVPHRLELLPATRVGDVAGVLAQVAVGEGGAPDTAPAVEVAVRAPVAGLELLGRHAGRREDRVSRVVEVPVAARDASLGGESPLQPGAWVRRHDMERRRLDAPAHGPLDCVREDGRVVMIHAEDEGAVDHDAEVVQAADGGVVPGKAAEVLRFAGAAQVRLAQRLEPDEQAAQPALDRLLQEAGAQDGLHRPGRLPEAAHPLEAVEERCGERRTAEEVVIEEVEVTPREAVDLGERVVDRLHVEGLAAAEERLLVAEVAEVRAAAAHDQGVGHEIPVALDEVAPRRRQPGERPFRGAVQRPGPAGAEVGEKRRPGVLARPAEHAVGVPGGLLRQARRVEAAEADVGAPGAVVVGVAVGAAGRGDVRLDDDQVRLIVEAQRLDVLVLQVDLVVRVEVSGQRREAERREERVLDRAPIAAVGGRLGRADHLDAERPSGRRAAQRGPAGLRLRQPRSRRAHGRTPDWAAKWASSTSSPVSNSPGRSHTASRMPTCIMLG